MSDIQEIKKTVGNKIITRRKDGRKRVFTMPEGESKTQQQFVEQCDVNNIIAKFKKTGSVTHVRNAQQGVYADLTQLPDLMEAKKTVLAAEAAFAEIPAQLRQRFSHDPQQLMDFLADPSNNEEAIKLGLKVPPKTTPPDPVLTELQTLNSNLSKNLNSKPKPKPTT